jgi:hypothetical protein
MELRTEIEIAAPPADVWRVLTDFASYGEWNPFIVQIDGALSVGAKLTVVLAPPGGSEMTFRPKLLVADPGSELRWRGQLFVPGLFDGEHFFRLSEVAPGRTRFTHGEDFKGLLVRLAARTLTNTARGFVFMNQALKRRVEEGRGD